MARGYVDPNFPNPNGPNDADIIIYGYRPSLVLAVLAAVLFGLAVIVAAGLLIRYKFRAMIFVTMLGAAMEVIGYAFRGLSSQKDPYHVTYFVVNYFFIVVAPVFFSAAVYLGLGRVLNLVKDQKQPVSARAVFVTFLVCDIVTTVMQVVGAALIGVAESNQKSPTTANNILLAGLALQTASFAVFLLVLTYCWAALANGCQYISSGTAGKSYQQLRPSLVLLLIVALLVQLRTAFRLAETAQGVFGYLSTHEAFFGALEFAPIALAVAGLLVLAVVLERTSGSKAVPVPLA
ncbi:hypothetical protein WJX72_010401 [[Myrmecia] bisecta]|uniref:RTA1 like protein n=1 Tax=[Myrmecia] bisecta TaxID=41462 RepID=A0AAW1Q9T8_9CHLO